MNKRTVFALWGILFIFCAGLGFLPEQSWLLTVAAILFFLPPAWLLYRGSLDDTRLIRNLSALSLGLTLVLLILNFFTAFSSEVLGQVLHYVLIIVSSPMICSGHWAMSLFLWACLLMASLKQLRR